MLELITDYLENIGEPMEERRAYLDKIVAAVKENRDSPILFVCTHNSRRSQLCEVWARTFASVSSLPLRIHSVGTEETAFNIRTVNALRRCGMEIEDTSEIDRNPHYLVRFAVNRSRLDCWSKTLDDPSISLEGAITVMTCDNADKNCPHIPEARLRAPLRFKDPKAYDDTPTEISAYDDCCQQVATEMKYLIDQLKPT